MNDKAFETPWQVFWCADVANQRLLHVSASVEALLGLRAQALLDDPLQWNHAVLPADAAAVPRPFFSEDLPHGDGHLREYRMLGADLHLYQVRDRRFRRWDAESARFQCFGVVEAVRELRPDADAEIEPSWEYLWATPSVTPTPTPTATSPLLPVSTLRAAAPAPRPKEERPAAPSPAPTPGPASPAPDRLPHEHGDDPGVHPDGPKRYHDDHAAPARMQHRALGIGEGAAA
ncbi:PAS domain-containing protein [Roseateles amylovorans]|uniref:PAS domain-containing protein n=1 Tax=Roseateles amylovorans TaxID=2978473 RepID=A0ABY6B5L6_9BURK|nr:PAS domain-containing protein [Roseateles amylovorans]UXH80549.1 PAS domain-containing protein [Roseateles amylovorans]